MAEWLKSLYEDSTKMTIVILTVSVAVLYIVKTQYEKFLYPMRRKLREAIN